MMTTKENAEWMRNEILKAFLDFITKPEVIIAIVILAIFFTVFYFIKHPKPKKRKQKKEDEIKL